MASKVYFMGDHACHAGESTPFKAVKLLRDAGIKDLFNPGDTVGIKFHTGAYGNSLNLRPHWIRAIVDEVKRLGGYPVIIESNFNLNGFGCDRQDTAQHKIINTRHGITEETMGCPIWLPDGAMEIEGEKCEIPHGVYLNHTFVSKQMLRCDAVIVVSHFKGHMQGTYGGAIKNIGIGMCSSRGKSAAHFLNHPDYGVHTGTVNQEVAQQMMQYPSPNMVDGLVKCCPFDAYEVVDGQLVFHSERCKDCSACFYPALFSGVMNFSPALLSTTPVAIADSCSGIMNKIGKDKFMFVNYAYDITANCDCANYHDAATIPNIGTFVSKDPVAVDMACLEACEATAVVPNTAFDKPGLAEPNSDRFTHGSSMAQVSQWAQINAGVYNEIGSSEYTLIESEPLSEAEVMSWISDYGPGNPLGFVFRDLIRKANFDTEGVIGVKDPRLSFEELYKRPQGMQEKLCISQDTTD